MMHNTFVALDVIDEKGYQKYRDEMTPILEKMGGYFLYDFQIKETLKSPEGKKYNRTFVISFPSEEVKENFFSDERYLSIREEFFSPSVGLATIITSYT